MKYLNVVLTVIAINLFLITGEVGRDLSAEVQ